jgi:hypothetical protein
VKLKKSLKGTRDINYAGQVRDVKSKYGNPLDGAIQDWLRFPAGLVEDDTNQQR